MIALYMNSLLPTNFAGTSLCCCALEWHFQIPTKSVEPARLQCVYQPLVKDLLVCIFNVQEMERAQLCRCEHA